METRLYDSLLIEREREKVILKNYIWRYLWEMGS